MKKPVRLILFLAAFMIMGTLVAFPGIKEAYAPLTISGLAFLTFPLMIIADDLCGDLYSSPDRNHAQRLKAEQG